MMKNQDFEQQILNRVIKLIFDDPTYLIIAIVCAGIDIYAMFNGGFWLLIFIVKSLLTLIPIITNITVGRNVNNMVFDYIYVCNVIPIAATYLISKFLKKFGG